MIAWGMDRSRRGWAVVRLDGDVLHLDLVSSAGEVARALGPDDVVAADIPMAPFPNQIGRRSEVEARAMLGNRASTVFPTLPEWCYRRPYDDEARDEARRRYGKAYSKQAWNLGPAIFEIDEVRDGRWYETHPELAFTARNGWRPMPPKTTWDGIRTRLDVLARSGVDVPMGGFRLPVPPHDVLDAAVCMVVARTITAGEARRLPAESEGSEAVIWY